MNAPFGSLAGDKLPAMQRSLSDVVAEYDAKRAAVTDAIKAFERAGSDLKMSATIGGTFGDATINTGHVHGRDIERSLLCSAWRHVYEGLNIKLLASPREKDRFEQAMRQPPEFTLDNIRATFGHYVKDPRGSMLRALAEVFCDLDPAYKSHDKVKIGVAGLPKRVILGGFGDYSTRGRESLQAILGALAVYQGKPQPDWDEVSDVLKNECALLISRGVRLRRFGNGNGHLFFEPDTLRDINKALAEFYGDVLPDTTEEKPEKPRAGTAVAKDLQYYPTPLKVVENLLSDIYVRPGQRALDPSCGCGRILTGLRKAGAIPFGIEFDTGRVAQARAKGFDVLHANFLETEPVPQYDHVVMNPPFYGKHYFKHVAHALKFLKPGGRLTAILPITARYDHDLLGHLGIKADRWREPWRDLPVGSFAESGTNINTTVLTLHAAEIAAR